MHEAALAGMVAIDWRKARNDGVLGRPRLLIRGGHDEPVDFDAALRLHLQVVAPELDPGALEIVHLPIARLCGGCGRQFKATAPSPVCPTCGSVALPSTAAEEVELDWPNREAS